MADENDENEFYILVDISVLEPVTFSRLIQGVIWEGAKVRKLRSVIKSLLAKSFIEKVPGQKDTYKITEAGLNEVSRKADLLSETITNASERGALSPNLSPAEAFFKRKGLLSTFGRLELNHGSKTFLCYSRSDSTFALKLAGDLRKAGYNIWIDQLDISPGDRWAKEVQKALHDCPCFLVLLSAKSVDSDNVNDEIDYAVDKKKRILPLLLEQCEVPLRIRSLQYIDFTKNREDAFIKLTNKLDVLK